MRASLLTRAGVAAAAGAIALTGVVTAAGAASATTAHTRRPTSLSIAAITLVAPHKRMTGIVGGLRSNNVPVRGRTVFLDRVVGGKLIAVAHMKTDARGGVLFSVHPITITRYELVFKGDATFKPSHSRILTVIVRPS